jgi:hypothetical protein
VASVQNYDVSVRAMSPKAHSTRKSQDRWQEWNKTRRVERDVKRAAVQSELDDIWFATSWCDVMKHFKPVYRVRRKSPVFVWKFPLDGRMRYIKLFNGEYVGPQLEQEMKREVRVLLNQWTSFIHSFMHEIDETLFVRFCVCFCTLVS